MVSYEKLATIQGEYINSLFEFSESQVWYWQRIPRLAAMADGRSGFSDVKSYAYREGFWKVRNHSDSSYPYRVDLATGTICSWQGYYDGEIHRAKPSQCMMSLAISELHAKEIYNRLLEEIQTPFASYYDRSYIDRYYEELEKMNIPEVYTNKRIIHE